MSNLSHRVRSLSMVGTVAISARAASLIASGHDVLNLSIGAPDFDTPQHAAEAAIHAIKTGQTRYTSSMGHPSLREAIRAKFLRENNLRYGDDEVTIGTGGKQVILNLMLATLDPGDEVIVPAPYYSSYPDIVKIAGGQPVIVPCTPEDGFKLTPEALERAITPRTRWLVLNSPSNPTGAVYTREELEMLADVLRQFPHINILSDEIYEHSIFTDEPYVSFASLDEEMFSRTATVNGISKTYGMTGWRIGFAGGPSELMRAATKIQSQSTTCPTSISQIAAAHALTGPQDIVLERRAVLRRRRDTAVDVFNRLPGMTCKPPDGAIYLFVDCSGLIGRRTRDGQLLQSDLDVAEVLLDTAKVSTVPGVAFGRSPYLRITFALDETKIEQAADRIAATLAEFH